MWIKFCSFRRFIPITLTAVLFGIPSCTLNLDGPAPYMEHTQVVTSADGTRLVAHYFPALGLAAGATAPTVMIGSGWSFPAYPEWLDRLDTGGSFQVGLLTPAELRRNGYNVVTWDNRGFGTSDGPVDLLNVTTSGADIRAIIDWIATEPSATLQAPSDPIVGVTGASYGAGLSIVAGIADPRVDAIVPNMGWNSLTDSLYPNQVVNAGWGNILCGLGDGLSYLFGQMGGPLGTRVDDRLGPRLRKVCNVLNTGVATPDDVDFLSTSSPAQQVGSITTPTLILAGTADTLFPLNGDITNYRLLAKNGSPLKMMWYCGGHGICNTPTRDMDHMRDAQFAWFDTYLKGAEVDAGPGFEWADQFGKWHSETNYPEPSGNVVRKTGSGRLNLLPFSFSGFFIVPTPAWNAITLPIPSPASPTTVLHAPMLTLKYRGTGSPSNAAVFAQLVDDRNNTVAGSQITPIRLQLDGAAHEVTMKLNTIAWAWSAQSPLSVQITDSSTLFFRENAVGSVDFSAITIEVPTA
ncbi:MAG: CocE/NonD family hydrolase [Acidimicrobiia bacterium]